MKIYDKKLAYPYFVWMTLFTVVPLLIVVYYAFTRKVPESDVFFRTSS